MTDYCAHADLDAFFLSVEVALNPALRGRPAAVAGGDDSVVVSASYQARAAGVRAGTSVRSARQACPALVVVPGRIAAYRAAAARVFGDARAAAEDFRRLSIDEGSWGAGAHADPMAALRAQVRRDYGLPLTVGLAPTRTIARIACAHAKPDGLLVVTGDETDAFLDRLRVGELPGVGPATSERLASLGVQTVLQLRALDPARAADALGDHLYRSVMRTAAGEDAPLVDVRAPTTGAEKTYREPLDPRTADVELDRLTAAALHRVHAKGMPVRAVTVTSRQRSGQTVSRSSAVEFPTMDVTALTAAARAAWASTPRLAPISIRVTCAVVDALDQPALPLQLAGVDQVLPPLIPPTLRELAHVGLRVEHRAFGPGRVVGLQGHDLGVAFADRTRILDVDRAPLAVVPTAE